MACPPAKERALLNMPCRPPLALSDRSFVLSTACPTLSIFAFASASDSTAIFVTSCAPINAILLIPVSDLLPLSLAVQVVKRFELPPLRYIHEFPRLAIAILCYLKAHPILRRLPIRAIGSDPASQRDPFKACI